MPAVAARSGTPTQSVTYKDTSDYGPEHRDRLAQLVREQPLAHPLVTSIACFDFDLAPPPHLREIYGATYRAMSDDYPEAPDRLGRLMPREHGKTEAGTIVVPAWAALRNPNIRILLMSINEDKATDKLSELADHIKRLAPQFGRDVVINNETQLQLKRNETFEEPTVQAAGFKTGVTGGHYDVVIFDDIVTYETQRTEHRRKHAWKKFQDFLNLDTKAGNSTFLVLATRKHRRDLYSQLIQGPKWDVRVEQAISSDDWAVVENGEFSVKTRHQDTGAEQWYDAGDMGSIDTEVETVVNIDVHRDEVAVLWPEWAPIESLIDDMITGYGADQGTLIWQRENQNDPAALQGEILSADMLEFVSDLPESGLRLYAGVDVAAVEDPEAAARGDSDYWAFAALAEDPSTDLAYLVRLRRKRGMTLGEAVEWIGDQLAALSNRFGQGVNKVLAESNNTQRWIVQAAQDEGYRIEKSTSSGEKDARIVDMSSKFERSEVLVWEGAMNNWRKFISDEWCDFPTGAHDDRLDAIEIALRNLDRGGDDEWSSSDVGLDNL